MTFGETITAASGDGRFPGPVDPWGVGRARSTVGLLTRPLAMMSRLRSVHGPLVGFPSRRPGLVFAFGADEAREVLTAPEFSVDAFRHLRLVSGSPMLLLTSGLLRLNGDEHRRRRRALRGPFAPRNVARHGGTVLTVLDSTIDGWLASGTADLHRDLAAAVTRVSLAAMAGVDQPEEAQRLHHLMEDLARHAGHPVTSLIQAPLPGTPFRRMTRTAAEIEAVLRALLARARADGERPDLLSHLARSERTDSDDSLIGDLYTALCHDSVASSLFWTLVLLDQHPRWRDAVAAEVDAVLGERRPGAADLGRMPVLDRVVRESLRLLPPAGFLVRYAEEGARVRGHPVRPGAMVVVSPFVTHRDPGAFDRPLSFHPERWESERVNPGYFPFGTGPHHCVGRSFAEFEVKLMLARTVQRCAVVLPDRSRVDVAVRISTVPRRPVPVLIAPRGAPRPAGGRVTGGIRDIVDLRTGDGHA